MALSFAATIGLALASVVWSESWFYGLAVQVVRYVTFRWRVAASNWKRVFIVGALFGWLIEGVLVTTVVEDLPLSISYTGLAWHALFTVLLGWWWVPRVLERPLPGAIARLCILGVGVGAWASFWRFEEGASIPVAEYVLFAVITTAAYAAGLMIWWALRGGANPTLGGSAIAMVLLLAIAVAAARYPDGGDGGVCADHVHPRSHSHRVAVLRDHSAAGRGALRGGVGAS